jgi:hypothetical protein
MLLNHVTQIIQGAGQVAGQDINNNNQRIVLIFNSHFGVPAPKNLIALKKIYPAP